MEQQEAAKAALPAALWVSQVLDWELARVPKSERQSMMRLMQVFSEHSDRPELPDDAVLRRSFKALSASYIQQLHENAELKQRLAQLDQKAADVQREAEAQLTQQRGELATTRVRAKNNESLVEDWKKRCNGWKRNCLEVERKYKMLAALAQHKLGLNEKSKEATAQAALLPELEKSEADAILGKLSDTSKPKPKPAKPKKMKQFRLGDDINPPKEFGVREGGRRHGVNMGNKPIVPKKR